MITIHDIMQLQELKEFTLLNSEENTKRMVKNVAILDYEPIQGRYDVFRKDEFILTSMVFAHDNPQLGKHALEELLKREVSGIAIKDVFYQKLDQEFIELANLYHCALFIYRDIYMEEVILAIKNLLVEDLQYLQHAQIIQQILDEPQNSESLLKTLYPLFFQQFVCIAWASDTPLSYVRLHEIQDRFSSVAGCFITRYQDVILTFISMDELTSKDAYNLMKRLLPADIATSPCGISECVELKEGSYALKEALHCLKYADKSSCFYEDLNEEALFAQISNNWFMRRYYEHHMRELMSKDKGNQMPLMETIREFVNAHGDIKKCGEVLYQHPNTVRYRLQKVKTLMKKEDMDDKRFYEYLYLLILMQRAFDDTSK